MEKEREKREVEVKEQDDFRGEEELTPTIKEQIKKLQSDVEFEIKWDQQTKKFFYFDQDCIKYEWNSDCNYWFPAADQSLFDEHLQERSKKEKQKMIEEKSKNEKLEKERDSIEELTKQSRPVKSLQTDGALKVGSEKQRKNTSIYVQGLPADISIDKLHDYFSRCGIIMSSLYDQTQPRIKIYLDDSDTPKGDALITFLMEESVEIAISLFDQSQIRPGCYITVQLASFEQSSNDTKVAKSSGEKHQMKVAFERMKRKLEWGDAEVPDLPQNVHRTVLLKGMFAKTELDQDSSIAFDIKAEVRDECSEKCGPITRINLYPNLEGGFMTVKFKEVEGAKKCIQIMNGRWFDGRRIEASLYDGSLKEEEII